MVAFGYNPVLRPSGGMADAVVSKTSVERRASSSLAPGTKSLEEAVGATFLVREKCIDSNWEVATGQWPVAG